MRPKKVDMCASKEDCVFQWTRAGRVLPEIAKKAKKHSKKDLVLQSGSCHLCYKHLCLVAPQARIFAPPWPDAARPRAVIIGKLKAISAACIRRASFLNPSIARAPSWTASPL